MLTRIKCFRIYGSVTKMKSFINFCSVFRRRADAVAFISGGRNYPKLHGTVFFYAESDGVVVRAEIDGLPKAGKPCSSPIYAIHIHDGTECTGNGTDDFANTGGHYNPNNCPHPYHAGDLPPLFSVNGKAMMAFLTDRFMVKEIIGKTVIIHSRPDDFTTQPSGNAGEKIACGVITLTAR